MSYNYAAELPLWIFKHNAFYCLFSFFSPSCSPQFSVLSPSTETLEQKVWLERETFKLSGFKGKQENLQNEVSGAWGFFSFMGTNNSKKPDYMQIWQLKSNAQLFHKGWTGILVTSWRIHVDYPGAGEQKMPNAVSFQGSDAANLLFTEIHTFPKTVLFCGHVSQLLWEAGSSGALRLRMNSSTARECPAFQGGKKSTLGCKSCFQMQQALHC